MFNDMYNFINRFLDFLKELFGVNMRNRAGIFTVIIAVIVLSACTTNNRSTLQIGDNDYVVGSNDKLQITKKEYEKLLSGEIKASFIKGVEDSDSGKKALALNPEEINILMQDRRLFFAELDKKQDSDVVAILFRKGLVKNSLEYIAESNGWNGVEWMSDKELVNDKPFAVVGTDFQSVLIEAIKDFPISVTFDEKNKLLKFKVQE